MRDRHFANVQLREINEKEIECGGCLINEPHFDTNYQISLIITS